MSELAVGGDLAHSSDGVEGIAVQAAGAGRGGT